MDQYQVMCGIIKTMQQDRVQEEDIVVITSILWVKQIILCTCSFVFDTLTATAVWFYLVKKATLSWDISHHTVITTYSFYAAHFCLNVPYSDRVLQSNFGQFKKKKKSYYISKKLFCQFLG